LAFSPVASHSGLLPRVLRSFRRRHFPSWRLRAYRTPSKVGPCTKTSFRKFEILLPLQFNDGSPVPDKLIADTILQPREHYDAVSCETQTIYGIWTHEAGVYRDYLICLFADAPDTQASIDYFLRFKEQLKVAFNQLDIWMTTYPIEVL
jgi:hypothetical protein